MTQIVVNHRLRNAALTILIKSSVARFVASSCSNLHLTPFIFSYLQRFIAVSCASLHLTILNTSLTFLLSSFGLLKFVASGIKTQTDLPTLAGNPLVMKQHVFTHKNEQAVWERNPLPQPRF